MTRSSLCPPRGEPHASQGPAVLVRGEQSACPRMKPRERSHRRAFMPDVCQFLHAFRTHVCESFHAYSRRVTEALSIGPFGDPRAVEAPIQAGTSVSRGLFACQAGDFASMGGRALCVGPGSEPSLRRLDRRVHHHGDAARRRDADAMRRHPLVEARFDRLPRLDESKLLHPAPGVRGRRHLLVARAMHQRVPRASHGGVCRHLYRELDPDGARPDQYMQQANASRRGKLHPEPVRVALAVKRCALRDARRAVIRIA
jgi:hypothetical protein